MLTEAQFQTLRGSEWVLMDGRSVVGSIYETITGEANIPDARGTYLRSKDNGRGLDPNGDPDLGTYQADEVNEHKHSSNWRYHTGGNALAGTQMSDTNTHMPGSTTSIATATGTSTNTINNTGGNETRPKSTVVNTFIKIN
jgi:hypothetical protein